jgi:prevent-host-death family protein
MITTETATNFNREPSRILSKAERGQTVLIEKHGRPCAVLIPYPQPASGDEMARRLRRLDPMPEAAAEMEKLMEELDDASRRSYGSH